jgi:hypothetical protein
MVWWMVSLGQLAYFARDLQCLLPPGDLAVVRVATALLDVEIFSRSAPSQLRGIDVGQSADLRYPLLDRGSLHLHLFPGYVEAHIDANDPSRHPVAHVVEATHVGPAALAGAAVVAVTGAWLPAILVTALGASVPSQRRRVFELHWDRTRLTFRAIPD